MISNFK